MNTSKLLLIWNTVKFLTFQQIWYQIFYKIRNKFFPKKNILVDLSKVPNSSRLHWETIIDAPNSYKESSFTFLNIKQNFTTGIDWNYGEYGKLWTYNLNYFDFLLQEEITRKEGLSLINSYVENHGTLIEGLDPYPISLRGMNWVKFLSKHEIYDENINRHLFEHYQILLNHLEYHLLGNHLLENGFSLLFGAYYFKHGKFYKYAYKILIQELEIQTLKDGAHCELSPMYHKIIFFRLLDSIQLIQCNPWRDDSSLLQFLMKKASEMRSWLNKVTYTNGETPMVNDASFDIAYSSKRLFEYGNFLNIEKINVPLGESGYRTFNNKRYELFVDAGNIGPDYQPGHAHSDTFNFELHVDGQPIIVDRGTSTYENNELRQVERSTRSHNTVQIGEYEQTQVWGGFRVGRRAKITHLEESSERLKATHDGFKKIGFYHTREFVAQENTITIHDKISKSTYNEARAYFHFYSGEGVQLSDNKVTTTSNVVLSIEGASKIEKSSYQLAKGFYKTEKASCIIVTFDQNLKTSIRV